MERRSRHPLPSLPAPAHCRAAFWAPCNSHGCPSPSASTDFGCGTLLYAVQCAGTYLHSTRLGHFKPKRSSSHRRRGTAPGGRCVLSWVRGEEKGTTCTSAAPTPGALTLSAIECKRVRPSCCAFKILLYRVEAYGLSARHRPLLKGARLDSRISWPSRFPSPSLAPQ